MNGDDYITIPTALQQLLTTDQAWHYHIVPEQEQENALSFYADTNAINELLIDELEMLFGKPVRIEHADAALIHKTLGKYYRKTYSNSKTANISTHRADDFLVQLILEAKNLGSSDIHIEIYEDKARVRIRIDGMLVERYQLGKADYPALVNKVKIKANLDISEKRLPQDGRININLADGKLDIRVSILPTLHGEKMVLRLLSNDATNIDIEALGFSQKQLHDYLEGIKTPNGILLISGPTGSGKTTTLYATLKILNEEKRNIMTVEDPIEYTLEGINQVQLKESIGLTFAGALRSFLRQDPDVIMLGEIRDGETAQMAIRAALTGHLVLSTIHTNSAWGTVSRLIDMEVPPFLLSNTLNTTVAQRLLRLLCDCKETAPFDADLFPASFRAPKKIMHHHRPVGCEHCYYTGYKGRTAIYEVIPIDYELSETIRANRFDIQTLLEDRNITTLASGAFNLFEKGITSIEEVYPLLLNSL